MSYESRIYIVDRCEYRGFVFGHIIATLDLSCMPPRFKDVFEREIDYRLIGDNDTDLTLDCYGEHCKYATVGEVLDRMQEIADGDEYFMTYRRAVLLSATLGTVKDWLGDIQVVHYGY